MSDQPHLRLDNLTKKFDRQYAVRDLSLEVPKGSVLALLGPSGSGKTTTLRLLAGFETPDQGRVWLDGRDVTGLSPAARRFGMVFQHYALFPHLTVGENVAFGLSGEREQRQARVSEMLGLVDLAGFEGRAVSELSGGQQQRIAVARALAPQPEILCLDEPLSNLDPALRERTRRELRTALEQVGITTVFVTHEQDEAFALADVIAVMRDGRLEQVGTPEELYRRPATRFVATFVGRASELSGEMVSEDLVRTVGGAQWRVMNPGTATPGSRVTVVVRPEALEAVQTDGIPGTVAACRYTGARSFYQVDLEGGSVEMEDAGHRFDLSDRIEIRANGVLVFPTVDD